MTNKKFTDEEIIKALQYCAKLHSDCEECPLYCDYPVCKCEKYILDLINRQKKEIEKLKSKNKILSRNADNAFQEGLNECRELFLPEIKSEVYKEFSKEIKEEISKVYDNNSVVLREHYKTHKDNLNYEFIGAIIAKMNTLRGLDDFINNLLKRNVR